MELVLLLIEAVVLGVLSLALAAGVELFVACFALALRAGHLIAGVVIHAGAKLIPALGQVVVPDAPGPRLTRVRKAMLVLTAVLGVLVAGVELFGKQVVLRSAAQRAGVELSMSSTSGTLIGGHLVLEDVRARRESGTSRFDVAFDRIEVDVAVWASIFGAVEVPLVDVRGVRGELERLSTSDAPAQARDPRDITVERLHVEGVEVTWRDHSKEPAVTIPLRIDALDVAPLRRRWAVFDVLYRAEASGEVAGRPFALETVDTESGRRTTWRAEALPVGTVRPYLGRVGQWLRDAELDVEVVDEWSATDEDVVVMRYRFTLRDVKLGAPPDATMKSKLALRMLGGGMGLVPEIPFAFELSIQREDLEGSASQAAYSIAGAAIAAASGAAWGAVKGAMKRKGPDDAATKAGVDTEAPTP